MDVALVTCAALPGLHRDDRILLAALRAAGVDAEPVVWEDPYQDWREPRLCVIRSTWDYAFRRDAFVEWARSVASVTHLWNSAHVTEWNTHKRYLCDLADREVSVVPTRLLKAGDRVELRAVLTEIGWEDVVIKAAVAQSGRYAMRVGLADIARGQAHLDRLLPHEDMLLQPYLVGVQQRGELSVVVIDGECTHAVRKIPAAGDFRVHEDHGGSVAPVELTQQEFEAAGTALHAVGESTLYARVDLVPDQKGAPVVMELELVEPELFFDYSRDAVELMVRGIRERLERSPAA
jgi:glutathione synthase/RimK-type ligase-like ATP-grasp enzyme